MPIAATAQYNSHNDAEVASIHYNAFSVGVGLLPLDKDPWTLEVKNGFLDIYALDSGPIRQRAQSAPACPRLEESVRVPILQVQLHSNMGSKVPWGFRSHVVWFQTGVP